MFLNIFTFLNLNTVLLERTENVCIVMVSLRAIIGETLRHLVTGILRFSNAMYLSEKVSGRHNLKINNL